MIKYLCQYYDTENIQHKVEILDDAYLGDPIPINGSAVLSNPDIDDPLESIRGQGLTVNLDADTGLTFSDLWSEDEKTFQVKYYRANVLKFLGWLNSDGFFEDFVTDKWVATFECVDGLGYLKDLAFVDNNGFPFLGKKTQLEILALALKRTGVNQYIYTNIDIFYTGLATTVDILTNVYINTQRYVKDDDETIMSCDEVIRGILQPYGAVLISYNNKWVIVKPNLLAKGLPITFFRYDYTGVASGTETIDFNFTLGSHVNGFYPHHCNENQRIENSTSLGAFRINYKYGLVKSLLGNDELYSANGSTIDFWNIINTTNMEPLVAGGKFVTIASVGTTGIEQLRSDPILLTFGQQVNIFINYYSRGGRGTYKFRWRVVVADKVITDPTANKYYLQDDLTWSALNVATTMEYPWAYSVDLNVITPPAPEAITGNSYLYIQIWTPALTPTGTTDTEIRKIMISPEISNGGIKGEFHTFQRTTKPSAKVKNNIEVSTGDNPTDLYVGTTYKNDQITPTETWFRKGITEAKPLLQIMGEETLRLRQSTSRIFSGDVYGFFDYLSIVTIQGVPGIFLVSSYQNDTKNNIVSATFRQIYYTDVADISYEMTYDYGNTVKPTIK